MIALTFGHICRLYKYSKCRVNIALVSTLIKGQTDNKVQNKIHIKFSPKPIVKVLKWTNDATNSF